MSPLIPLARLIILIGVLLLVGGGVLYLLGRANVPLGRLPGDFRWQTGNVTCFFPLATMIILSVVLTLALNILARFLNR